LVAVRGFADAADIAAVLHTRLARATTRSAPSGGTRAEPDLIAGLIPAAIGPMPPEMRHALDERRYLIEQRAQAVLDAAAVSGAGWLKALGQPPHNPVASATWRRHACVVAAYRDKYAITTDDPVGAVSGSEAKRLDIRYAQAAARSARRATSESTPASRFPSSRQRDVQVL
jgi:hypothetical protein